jgi:hypothetical protein
MTLTDYYTGKTFTLFGGGGVAGIVDHSIEMVYTSIMASVDTEYVVKCIFIELYNEEIKVRTNSGVAMFSIDKPRMV